MTYPDFIICAKCGAKWSTKDRLIESGKCLICGHPLKKEYRDKKYKPKFSTQYHLEPELAYTCNARKEERTCSSDLVVLGNYGECVGCRHRVIAEKLIYKKGVNHECNETKSNLQSSKR